MQINDLQPLQGSPETVIDRAARHIAPFDGKWFARCRPASSSAIELYGKLAGFGSTENRMPASFYAFLQHLGQEDGGLLEPFGIDARIDAVIEASRTRRRHHPEPEKTFAVVALTSLGEPIVFDLRAGLAEPPVMEDDDEEESELLARSWEVLIMRSAMLKVESRRLASGRWSASTRKTTNQALLASKKKSVAEIFDVLAEKHQLAVAWPSDERYRIAVGERFSVLADLNISGAVLLRMFASDRSLFSSVGIDFEQGMGAYGGGELRRDGLR